MGALIEKIQQYGFWRVNYRPKLKASLSLTACSELVERNSIRIRGWDFPHIGRADEVKNFGDYVEGTCDWERHIEFWRMYTSSQFLSYKVLWEDVPPREAFRPSEARDLSIGSAVYSIVEFVEFAQKLHQNGLYQEGLTIFIEIINSNTRQLWVNDPRRMDFSIPKRSLAPKITIEKVLEVAALEGLWHRKLAASVLIELFDKFGWEVSEDRMLSEIEKAYSRSL